MVDVRLHQADHVGVGACQESPRSQAPPRGVAEENSERVVLARLVVVIIAVGVDVVVVVVPAVVHIHRPLRSRVIVARVLPPLLVVSPVDPERRSRSER